MKAAIAIVMVLVILLLAGAVGHFLVLAAFTIGGALVGGAYGSARTALYYRRRRVLKP